MVTNFEERPGSQKVRTLLDVVLCAWSPGLYNAMQHSSAAARHLHKNNKNRRHLDGLRRHLGGFRREIKVADAKPGGILGY